jgi:N12 class adenine-specific DNA methylase
MLCSQLLRSSTKMANWNARRDMFFKRTIKPHKPVTEVDTADEALAVSMGEKAAIEWNI